MTDTTNTSTSRLEAGRHQVHVTHLVLGVVFLGLFLVWALRTSGVAHAGDLRWLLPLPLVLAGGAGLVATLPRLLGRQG